MPIKMPQTRKGDGGSRSAPPTDSAPAPSSVSRPVGAAEFRTLLSGKFKMADESRGIPNLVNCLLNIIGDKGSGKSELLAGCPRALVARLTDDHMAAPQRRLAEMVLISSLSQLEDLIAFFLKEAEKYGRDTPYCLFGVDSIYVLSDWLLGHELDLCNDMAEREFQRQKRYDETLRNAEFKPYKSIRDVPNSEKLQYPKVAKVLGGICERIHGYGCGFASVTHGQPGIEMNDGGYGVRSAYKSKLPGSHAREIRDLADINLIVKKECKKDQAPKYIIDFTSEKDATVGSRIPLIGSVELPDYNDPRTPITVTSWSVLEDAVDSAREALIVKQQEFRKAVGE